jgi:hypothetical protein
MSALDFPPAFLAIGAFSASAAFVFARLPHNAGAELSGRNTAPAVAKDNP